METYVNVLAWDYVARGLPNFLEDFRNPIYATWTFKEPETAINSCRVWAHLVSKKLPTLQIVLGLSVGQDRVFVRKGLPWNFWKRQDWPLPMNQSFDWTFARLTLFSETPNIIPAGD